MINVGMVGMGGISAVHLEAYKSLCDKATIIARCDKIRERAEGNAQGITINLGNGGTQTQVQARPYTDYRDLLADPEVKLVDICLPTDLHAEVAVAALEAGKHVLSEKPMARTVEQCDRMIAAAKASGKTLMVAHCIRFWPEYVYLKDVLDSGRYGALKRASFSRFSAPPRWSSENWLMIPERSGSCHLDMHVHDADYVVYLLGMPQQVFSEGTEDYRGIIYSRTQYQYGDDRLVSAEGGWDLSYTSPFRATFMVCFEQATLELSGGPLKVYPMEGEPFTPEIPAGAGYRYEIEYLLNCIERGEQPSVVTPWDARESVRLIFAEAASLRTHSPVSL